jgi:hypothetical protein
LEWEVGGDGTFMVVGTMTYPWCTSFWCATDLYVSGAPKAHAPRICLPPFPDHGPTELRGAWIRGVPQIPAICVAHDDIMRHGCGGLTPPAIVPIGAHICVAHNMSGVPRIWQDLWRIFLGVPRILIRGASKHGAP